MSRFLETLIRDVKDMMAEQERHELGELEYIVLHYEVTDLIKKYMYVYDSERVVEVTKEPIYDREGDLTEQIDNNLTHASNLSIHLDIDRGEYEDRYQAYDLFQDKAKTEIVWVKDNYQTTILVDRI